MPRYLVQVLGPPLVTDTRSGATVEFPAGKTLALLTYLLLHHAPPLRDQLYHLLWGDAPRERGLQSVRQALWLIRHTFGESALGGRDGTRVDPEIIGSDVALLEEALAGGRIEEGERLWRGPFLDRFAVAGAPDWDRWVEEVRLRLERGYGAALGAAAAADAARGDGEAAVEKYGRAMQVEPYRVEHRLGLIDVLLELRRGGDAEQVLDAARAALPEPEFAEAFRSREQRVHEALRDRALEPIAALSRPELVGRAHELADLIARWNLARRGRTQRVVLNGRSGVGKTRLAEELAAVVEQDRGRVVVVRTTEAEGTLPWATTVTLVRRLLLLPGAGGVSAGSDAVLRRLVPSLARSVSPEAGHTASEPAVLADAVADLIGAVAFEAPLLIVLDDCQWVDAGSLALLSRLVTQIESEPVLFVLTVRDGEVPVQAERALARVRQGGNAFGLRLANLSRAETGELLAYVLGSQQAASDGIGNRVYEVTRGNPLFIVETTKMLRDVGALRLVGERWVFDATRVPESFPLPDSIEQLLRQRVQALSPTAERIARLLAQRGGPQDIASLQPTGASRTAWADAIGELVDRGVVLRTPEGYVLAHEQIAAVVRAGPERPRRRRRIAAFAGAAVVVLAAAAAVFALGDRRAPYGGGAIAFADGADLLLIRRSPGGKDWIVRRHARPAGPHAAVRALRRMPDGSLRVAGTVMLADASPFAVAATAGEPRLIFRDRTDVETQSIAPTADRFLVGWDLPHTEAWDIAIAVVEPPDPEPRVLLRTQGPVGARWSHDGLAVAALVYGVTDTLLVLTPGGERLAQYHARDLMTCAWCADGTLLVVRAGNDPALLQFSPRDNRVREVTGGEMVAGGVACSPASSHALVRIIRDGAAAYAVLSLANGHFDVLPDSLPGLVVLDWVPDEVDPVPAALRLPSPGSLGIGERWKPQPVVVYSDGSTRAASADLATSDPRILAVSSEGMVIANRPGTVTLKARFRGWLEASTVVTVTADSDPGLLLSDEFRTLDTLRWRIVGAPPPRLTVFESDTVMHLAGDGNLVDGLQSRAFFPAASGLTAEVEFRLALTERRDRQRLAIGLCPVGGAQLTAFLECDGLHQARLTYPSGELAEFNPGAIAFGAFETTLSIDVPRGVPARKWTHLALQLRPDGYVEAVLDYRVRARSRLRYPNVGAVSWRVYLLGSSVETEVLARNLRVWRGLRYLESSDSTG